MHAGALEWCSDWYGEYPREKQTDPVGRESGWVRVVRGGGLQDLTPYYARSANRGGMVPDFRGKHLIGFRVVQGALPATPPLPSILPSICQRIIQEKVLVRPEPDPKRSHFAQRRLLPEALDTSPSGPARPSGLHPGLLKHNHSPGLEVCPNGDLLAVYYTSVQEYGPDVGLLATRLRAGRGEWDAPDMLFDIPDVNDHAPLLWRDGSALWLIWGGKGMPNVPFRWSVSNDSGKTWGPIRLAQVVGPNGNYTEQPINSAFRGQDKTIFVSCDGRGGESLLWASGDAGKTWRDTGGRTPGRHTAFVPLKDGALLALGGKLTDIGGRMPQAVSGDGGRTWNAAPSPFPALGNVQRPSVLRLASGRLFFASDYWSKAARPGDPAQRGSFVCISEDDGRTWRPWKRLPVQQESLGYCVARQGEDGVIHLITSKPAMHYEMNEAWILSPDDRSTR